MLLDMEGAVMLDGEIYLRPSSIAAFLGITEHSLSCKASRGDAPPSVRLSRRRLFPLSGLRRWIASKTK